MPVIEELRERILSGYYDHTAFLPSERRLAEELNVNVELSNSNSRVATGKPAQPGIVAVSVSLRKINRPPGTDYDSVSEQTA